MKKVKYRNKPSFDNKITVVLENCEEFQVVKGKAKLFIVGKYVKILQFNVEDFIYTGYFGGCILEELDNSINRVVNYKDICSVHINSKCFWVKWSDDENEYSWNNENELQTNKLEEGVVTIQWK